MVDPSREYLEAWRSIANTVVDWSRAPSEVWRAEYPFDRWFDDGALSLTWNCVDRHVADRPDAPALLWEGEPGDKRAISYAELQREVLALSRALTALGVARGDRVALHLGWIPETVIAMLACARIGAVHNVISTPLHTEGLVDRLTEFSPKVLFTQDGAWRRGTILPLKSRADDALGALRGVEQTVVVRRTGVDVSWYEGDIWYHDLIANVPHEAEPSDEPPALPARQPLASTHVANRKGRPLSMVMSVANVLTTAAAVHRYGLSDRGSDGGVFWLPGDASWLATQVHGVYGPLCNGASVVMFEGTLDTPTHTRMWEIASRYEVDTIVFAPSVAQALRDWSLDMDKDTCRLSTVRRCVTVGEKSDHDLRRWLADEFCRTPVSVGDAWGQIALGGIVHVENPVRPDMLPEPALEIVDPDGFRVADGDEGELVLRYPWPGMVSDVVGEAAGSVIDDHWNRYPDVYATGDKAVYVDNAIHFLGRRDQVTSISGQLVSLTEIRATLLEHPDVRNADVVPFQAPSCKSALAAAVVLDPSTTLKGELSELAKEILDHVRDSLGGLERPRLLLVIDRFGDELTATSRRATLAVLAAAHSCPGDNVTEITWSRVLAAAGHDQG